MEPEDELVSRSPVAYHVILKQSFQLCEKHFFLHVAIGHDAVDFTFLNSSGCWMEGLDKDQEIMPVGYACTLKTSSRIVLL